MNNDSGDIKNIIIISDGTGKTARRLMDAVLIQYSEKDIEFSLVNTYQEVRDETAVNKVLDEIEDDYLVLFSIISKDLADYLIKSLNERKIMHLSVLQPMLDVTSKFLGVHPDYMPGKLHIINDNYYSKVDAIGYAVSHDDGRGRYLDQADAVLLGISRTCKTPVSMYLACNFGLNIANIPLLQSPDWTERLLARLKNVDHKRIIGLIMQPETLAAIRERRSRMLIDDLVQEGELLDYYNIRNVTQEYRFSLKLFEKHGWRVIDVTRRAIEEISQEVMQAINHKNS